MTPRTLPPRDDDDAGVPDLDALFRESAPAGPSERDVDRLAAAVGRRLGARRRLVRGVALSAAAALVAGALLSFALFIPRGAPSRPDIAESPSPESPAGDGRSDPAPVPVAERVERALVAQHDLRESFRAVRESGPAAFPMLLAALRSEDADRALASAHLLLRMKDSAADEVLFAFLSAPDAPDARNLVLDEMLSLEDRDVRRLLPGLLQIEDVDRRVLRDLAVASATLFRHGLALARTSSSLPLRAEAVRLLAARSPDRAARILGEECARGEPADAHDPERGARRLAEFLQLAFEGLPESSVQKVAMHLAPHRRDDGGDRLVAAIGRCKQPEAWPLLARFLAARGADLRTIVAAGAFGDARAVPWLRQWTTLGDARGRAAVDALGRIPGKSSYSVLLTMLTDTANVSVPLWPGFRGALIDALRQDREANCERLRMACRRPVRQSVYLRAFVEVFPEKASEDLPRLFATSSPQDRPRICKALVDLDRPASFQTLVAALTEPSLHRLARQSLRQLAGRDLGPGPARWHAWYRGRQASAAANIRTSPRGAPPRLLPSPLNNIRKETS